MARATATGAGTRERGVGLIAGRYSPERPLGSGGSGSVWLAHDEQTARDVALKVVRREGKAASRAEREVEAAARLRHPRCLRALALDRDEEHVYVAYEYVRGRTLREALRDGTLDDAAAVEAAAQMLEGLAHAHSKGVVHRDVKPANVMVEEDDEVSIRLLDFGLAHLDEADTLTAVGDVPGTLSYVSPERLDGAEPSGAADVWGVGVCLWEALVGWHPFTAASPVEVARRIREGAQPLARSRPDLPAELCALADAMLDRDPKRRPSAKRLPDALRDALATQARRPRPAVSRAALRERAVHAALVAAFTAGAGLLLPFFPSGWPFFLGALAGIVALRSPRAGLALALAAPILPLGNVAFGLAIAYSVAALAWFLLFVRDPASGLLVLAGPVLVPWGGLGLLPLVASRASDRVHQAAVAGGGILLAAVVAAVSSGPFPLDGALPAGLEPGEMDGPVAAAQVVLDALASAPALLVVAGVAVGATLALPLARRRGLWGAALWGSSFLAAVVLLSATADATPAALPLAAGIWAASLVLAAPFLRRPEA